jgi:hypothetical protein
MLPSIQETYILYESYQKQIIFWSYVVHNCSELLTLFSFLIKQNYFWSYVAHNSRELSSSLSLVEFKLGLPDSIL